MTKKVFVFSLDNYVRRLFQTDFFEVHFFSYFENLYKGLEYSPPSILILDYKLVIRIGPDNIQKICKNLKCSHIFLIGDESCSYFFSLFCELGIKNHITTPCNKENLIQKIISLLQDKEDISWCNLFDLPEDSELANLLGQAASMKHLKQKIYNIGRTDNSILLLGESGTGKTHMAKLIHRLSHRKEKPFCALNMAAIPEQLAEAELFGTSQGAFTGAVARQGFFAAAEGGTLFMDEIGELSPSVQSKLLHVLEEGFFTKVGSVKEQKCDIRFLFATNSNLTKMVENRQFRNDLFYRISAFPVLIPPLRDRKEDIPILAEYFLRPHEKVLSESGIQKLYSHHWPGNIRELKNCLLRATFESKNTFIEERHISFD